MKRLGSYFLYCIFILLSYSLGAQQKKIDSLLIVLKTVKEDSTQVNTLNALCKRYTDVCNYSQAMLYGKQALEHAEKLSYRKGAADSYRNIGVIYMNQGDLKKALENYLKSLKIFKEIGNRTGIANSYNNIGIIYCNQGNFEKALLNYFKSLKIKEKIGDKKGIAASYNNIGIIYCDQGNYEKALLNYLKSLKIKEEIGDKKGIADSRCNIGFIYSKYKQYENALDNCLKAAKIYEEIGYKHGVASSYGNIGNIYFSLGNYEKSLEGYLKNLKTNEDMGNPLGIAASYANIGNVYKMQGRFKESNYYLNQSLVLLKKNGYKDRVKDVYYYLSELYDKKGDYKQAYINHKLYSDLKDTLYTEQSSKHLTELQVKYDTEKKENEIKLLNNENKIKALEITEQKHQLLKHRILFAALLAGIILISVISWLFISRNRIKQKWILRAEHLKQQQLRTKAIIETQEKERKRIAQDLHDGIGHKLTILKFNFEKFIRGFRTISPEQRMIFEQTENILDETHKEVRTLSHSMMPKALQEREFADAVSDLVSQTFTNSRIKYSLKNDLPTEFCENIQVCLYRVLQELLNNILKYAQATEVAVQIFKNKSTIILFVEDNGIAIQNENITNGIGLHNIAGRINVLNGAFTIEPGPVKGTLATIRIPFSVTKEN